MIAGFCKSSDFLFHLLRLSGTDTPSCIRDHAIAAELIAAVLNFDISTGVLCSMYKLHLFIFFFRIDIDHRSVTQCLVRCHTGHLPRWCGSLLIRRLTLTLVQISLYDLHQLIFPVISDRQINAVILLDLSLICLHVAAHCHNDRIRILLLGTMQHLSAFPVRYVCYRARIDNINISFLVEINNFISFIL